jgi:hypothetical protein
LRQAKQPDSIPNNAQPLDAPVTVFLSVQTANEQRNYFVPGKYGLCNATVVKHPR